MTKKIKLKEIANCDNGDLLLIMAGERNKVERTLFKIILANKLKLVNIIIAPLWSLTFLF